MSQTCFELTHPLFHLTKPWWHERSWEWFCDVSKTICWRDVSKTNCWKCFQNLSWMIFLKYFMSDFSKISSWVIFYKISPIFLIKESYLLIREFGSLWRKTYAIVTHIFLNFNWIKKALEATFGDVRGSLILCIGSYALR